MPELQISNRSIPRCFVMDPKIHEVIFGDDLRDGMVVIIEDRIVRESSEKKPKKTDYEYLAFLKTRYWCMVTDLRYEDELVKFIGVYSNGRQMARTYHRSYCWVVRKDTLPV